MDAVYLVFASKDGQGQLWAARGAPGKALAEVRGHLPSGSLLTLTGQTLLPERAAILNIRPGEICKLADEVQNQILPLRDLAS
jgi:hypothetical protein